jgi:acyl carrier protein phosphodiesterase
MNWLAHLLLSEPDPPFRVGNLLPDLAFPSQLASLPESFQKGIRSHRQIDIFTDAHPRVKSCVTRFPPPYRRYGGILTDVYFDHLLARNWTQYSTVRLPDFISSVYRDIELCLPDIPVEAARALRRMMQEDWLGSYQLLSGIGDILSRISRRLRRPFELSGSLPVFQQYESAFSDDFHNFFPQLVAHVKPRVPTEAQLSRPTA